MDVRDILRTVDHTLLKQTATWEQIRQVCDDGLTFDCASVCIPPSFVERAAAYLAGRLPVCTVIGFPNGYSPAAVKVFEAKTCADLGADELDMVVNLGWVREGAFDRVEDEIRAVCQQTGKTVKVIIETCLLTDEEKKRLCEVVSRSGAAFIKTSTGFAGGGATLEDVRLLRRYSDPALKVKAAGGIAGLEDAEAFLRAGADRLGTSRIVAAVKASPLYSGQFIRYNQ